jgi:CBS-domain-containing membrane protein
MAEQVLRVRDIMSRDVTTVRRNDQLGVADALFQTERIRHLPVLDEDGLVCAVVSQRDLFRGALLRALGYGSRAEEKAACPGPGQGGDVRGAMHYSAGRAGHRCRTGDG